MNLILNITIGILFVRTCMQVLAPPIGNRQMDKIKVVNEEFGGYSPGVI
jgi:hypothetical protein